MSEPTFKIEAKLNVELMKKIAREEGMRKVRAVAVTALAIAIADCPRDTGELAASHVLKVTKDGFEIANTAKHAPFVHPMPQSMLNNGKAQWMYHALDEASRNVGLNFSSGGEL